MNQLRSLCLLLLMFLISCRENNHSTNLQTADIRDSQILPDSTLTLFPALQDRLDRIQSTLKQPMPVMLLSGLDSTHRLAEALALRDRRFTEYLYDTVGKKALRCEIFNVYAARPQEIPVDKKNHAIYKVELYNYAYNLTSTAWVDLNTQAVFSVQHSPQSQPDIPAYLKDLAIQMAIRQPSVSKALGFQPGEEDALMANTKSALNRTRCERSKHLCVAPTFTVKDKALWVIVDLTDHRVVGLRWTQTGEENKAIPRISEKKLRFDRIMECYCKQISKLERDNWKLNYVITTSDGLRISEVRYRDRLVVNSAKIVDWHVSYSNTEGFGYSDAVGCPEFSQAAVIAVSDPHISELTENGTKVGFALEQYFSSELWPLPCNYNYVQRFEFYLDGRFRMAGGSLGRGCGNNGTYRPVFRIAMAGNDQQFFQTDNSDWTAWNQEQWKLQSELDRYTKEGYLYKIQNKEQQGFYIEPNRGQFTDGSRGDFAYVYVTRQHADRDEGENDMISIGPCCNTDYQQGPEKFIEPNPEDIRSAGLVIWYVPQMKNDDTKGREYCWAESYLDQGVYKTRVYPCMAGPLFVPIKK